MSRETIRRAKELDKKVYEAYFKEVDVIFICPNCGGFHITKINDWTREEDGCKFLYDRIICPSCKLEFKADNLTSYDTDLTLKTSQGFYNNWVENVYKD